MRHVDEGLLHAYIDGAFEAGTAERAEIESHLAACADCRVRLDDARRVRDVAQVALDAAAPAQAAVPSWDAIVAERARRGGTGAPAETRARPRIPLAWAASLVLAIGAGWMARAMVAERALAPDPAESGMVAPAPSTEADRDRDAAGERASESREAFRSPAAAVSGLQRGAATAPQDRVQSEPPPARRTDRERQEELAKAAAPPPPQITRPGAAGRAAQDELQRVPIAPQAALAEAALVGEQWAPADSAEIAAAFGREPIAVEGLTADTLQLAIVEGVPRARSVYVLPDGVVELVQRPAADIALADRAREAEADVLRTVLVIRGIEVTVRGTSTEVVRDVSSRVR